MNEMVERQCKTCNINAIADIDNRSVLDRCCKCGFLMGYPNWEESEESRVENKDW